MDIPQPIHPEPARPPIRQVLLTGGTGFIGAYILRELVNSGIAVRAIRRRGNLPAFIAPSILEKVEWVECDIHDIEGLHDALEGMDAVIHSAGKVSFHPRDRKSLMETNVQGTANLVNAALRSNTRVFVHLSSIAALGRRSDGGVVDEQAKWAGAAGQTTYALSKYQGELEVWRGMAEGLDAIIVNPATVLGYGDWTSSSCAIFRRIYQGMPWYTRGVNGFVGVEDVAAATVQLLLKGPTGERFILSAENLTYQEMLNAIADGLHAKRPWREATPLLSGIAWRMERVLSWMGRQPLVTKESARVALSNCRYDHGKILRALPGFRFKPVRDVIREACKKYLNDLGKESPAVG